MKGKKLWIKLTLDLVMLIVLLLLLRKNNFGIAFHEIAGLIVFGAFLLHLILNRKWIISVSKRIFTQKIGVRAKVSWAISAALLTCFILVGVSGILISKVVFSFSGGYVFKVIHYFFTALTLILLGIHLGLHATMIKTALKKLIPLPAKISKGLCIIVTCIILGFSCYGLTSTSFVHWIAMPFQNQTEVIHGNSTGQGQVHDHFFKEEGPKFKNRKDGNHQMHGIRNGRNHGIDLMNILSYLSLISATAMITAGFEQLRKKQQTLPIDTNNNFH